MAFFALFNIFVEEKRKKEICWGFHPHEAIIFAKTTFIAAFPPFVVIDFNSKKIGEE